MIESRPHNENPLDRLRKLGKKALGKTPHVFTSDEALKIKEESSETAEQHPSEKLSRTLAELAEKLKGTDKELLVASQEHLEHAHKAIRAMDDADRDEMPVLLAGAILVGAARDGRENKGGGFRYQPYDHRDRITGYRNKQDFLEFGKKDHESAEELGQWTSENVEEMLSEEALEAMFEDFGVETSNKYKSELGYRLSNQIHNAIAVFEEDKNNMPATHSLNDLYEQRQLELLLDSSGTGHPSITFKLNTNVPGVSISIQAGRAPKSFQKSVNFKLDKKYTKSLPQV